MSFWDTTTEVVAGLREMANLPQETKVIWDPTKSVEALKDALPLPFFTGRDFAKDPDPFAEYNMERRQEGATRS